MKMPMLLFAFVCGYETPKCISGELTEESCYPNSHKWYLLAVINLPIFYAITTILIQFKLTFTIYHVLHAPTELYVQCYTVFMRFI